ncbi:MAG: hypothetical protein M0Z58_06740 [Nitrospiraceae bacterium]|nr:hypothetical protein [Nitrospiraceae bacterium]
MKPYLSAFLVLLVSGLAFPWGVYGAPAGPPAASSLVASPLVASEAVVSLRQAVDAALKGNPQIRASDWAVKASREAVGVQEGYLFPSLSF